MHWSKRASRFSGALVLMTAVVVGPVATAADAADSVVTSTAVLAPNLVTSGRTAFYSATWTNGSNSTLTNPVAVITLPLGSTPAAGTWPGCTTATTSDSVAVSCPQHNLASGATVTQQLLVTMPAVTTITTVTAALTADEKGRDQNKSHLDVFPAPSAAAQYRERPRRCRGRLHQQRGTGSRHPGRARQEQPPDHDRGAVRNERSRRRASR